MTFTVTGWAGSTSNTAVSSATEGYGIVDNEAQTQIKASMAKYTPKNGQVIGSKTNEGDNWRLYNIDAIPGPITKIVVSAPNDSNNYYTYFARLFRSYSN